MENKSSGPVQTESSKTSGQVICPKCGTPFAAGGKEMSVLRRNQQTDTMQILRCADGKECEAVPVLRR